MPSQDDLTALFTYHTPTPSQVESYKDILAAGQNFATTIDKYIAVGATKDAMVAKVLEICTAAVAGIAAANANEPHDDSDLAVSATSKSSGLDGVEASDWTKTGDGTAMPVSEGEWAAKQDKPKAV